MRRVGNIEVEKPGNSISIFIPFQYIFNIDLHITELMDLKN